MYQERRTAPLVRVAGETRCTKGASGQPSGRAGRVGKRIGGRRRPRRRRCACPLAPTRASSPRGVASAGSARTRDPEVRMSNDTATLSTLVARAADGDGAAWDVLVDRFEN